MDSNSVPFYQNRKFVVSLLVSLLHIALLSASEVGINLDRSLVNTTLEYSRVAAGLIVGGDVLYDVLPRIKPVVSTGNQS